VDPRADLDAVIIIIIIIIIIYLLQLGLHPVAVVLTLHNDEKKNPATAENRTSVVQPVA
jgi:flagellar basal body-associated protein FliL